MLYLWFTFTLIHLADVFILAQNVRAHWFTGAGEPVHINQCVWVAMGCKFASPLSLSLSLSLYLCLSLSLSLSTAAVVQVDGQPLRLQLCDTAGQVKTTPLPFLLHSNTLMCVPYHQTIQTVQTFQTGQLLSMTPSDSTWMYVRPPCPGQTCSWRECSVSTLDTSGLSRPQKRCFTCTLTALRGSILSRWSWTNPVVLLTFSEKKVDNRNLWLRYRLLLLGWFPANCMPLKFYSVHIRI